MKINYTQFKATCSRFAEDALATLSATEWRKFPNAEVVEPLFNDKMLSLIFHDAMAEFLGSIVEIEKSTGSLDISEEEPVPA